MQVLIWGTGSIARRILDNGMEAEIIGFIESNKAHDVFEQKPVYNADEIPDNYDYIIVANSFSNEIYELCLEKNISLDKFIFMTYIKVRAGCTKLNIIREILGEKNFTEYCQETGFVEKSFFQKDLQLYQKLNTRENFNVQIQYIWPVIKDKYANAGTIGGYFWQDLWAAKLIYKSGVTKHLDIGSRLDGFIAHLLAMDIDVSIIDIREFPGVVENLHTIVDDATHLKQIPDESIQSMSALCSLEHFGLGRYGDRIDPEACFKCFAEIQKKMKAGGSLYLSVPVGMERVEFNAHRVFYARTIVECFPELQLKEFSCTANGQIEYNVELSKYDCDKHDGNYRYGLFHFVKKNKPGNL